MRQRRTRRVLKWAATAVCVLVFPAPLLTRHYVPVWRIEAFDCAVGLGQGGVVLFWATDPGYRFPGPGWFSMNASGPEWFRDFWTARAQNLAWCWTPYISRGWPFGILLVPSWVAAVLFGVPAAYLWWLDRRRIRPGHCQGCGYNLTGNVSGRCPECGEAV